MDSFKVVAKVADIQGFSSSTIDRLKNQKFSICGGDCPPYAEFMMDGISQWLNLAYDITVEIKDGRLYLTEHRKKTILWTFEDVHVAWFEQFDLFHGEGFYIPSSENKSRFYQDPYFDQYAGIRMTLHLEAQSKFLEYKHDNELVKIDMKEYEARRFENDMIIMEPNDWQSNYGKTLAFRIVKVNECH